MSKLTFFCSVLVLGGCVSALPNGMYREVAYYAPAVPPSSRYVIDAKVDVDRGVLEGREIVLLKNSGRNRIGVIAFDAR